MMTLKVLYTLCLLSCSVLPVTCWCPQSVSHLSLSAVYSPWSTQQPEWPLKNVYQSRFPCCWESSGDLPSVLEWRAQVLLQLSGSCGCSMQTLECADSVITHRLSCSSTWGFLDPRPEMEPCPLHWKVNCQPLDHQGSPRISVSFEFSEIGPKKISCPG